MTNGSHIPPAGANPSSNLDLVNVNAYAKFGLIPSIHTQNIEWKQSESQNDGQAQNNTPLTCKEEGGGVRVEGGDINILTNRRWG